MRKTHFVRALKERLLLRFHMSLILFGTALAGLLAKIKKKEKEEVRNRACYRRERGARGENRKVGEKVYPLRSLRAQR